MILWSCCDIGKTKICYIQVLRKVIDKPINVTSYRNSREKCIVLNSRENCVVLIKTTKQLRSSEEQRDVGGA